jgi:RNA polymerase sigma-70 factor (ECF subfamily)
MCYPQRGATCRELKLDQRDEFALDRLRNFSHASPVTLIERVGVSTDDERLVIEAAQADPARFVELYDRYVDRVYAYVSRRSGSRTVAEDVTSAVFEQALTYLPKFEWRGVPFSAWLLRIAANALADHWKRAGRDSSDPPPDVPDEREYRDLERRVGLFQLVDRLPEAQRQVIHMRFVEDRSIREVAAALEKSEGAVKQLQLRALDNLRKGIEERPAGRSVKQAHHG